VQNELTAVGNILFATTSLLGVYYFHHWLKNGVLTDNTKAVVHAWIIKDIAVFLRIGWWVLALLFADAGETYDTFFVDNKVYVTIPTALLYVYGQIRFIHHIIDLSVAKRISLMLVAVLIAVGITAVGF